MNGSFSAIPFAYFIWLINISALFYTYLLLLPNLSLKKHLPCDKFDFEKTNILQSGAFLNYWTVCKIPSAIAAAIASN
jgi:hypothetical protein